MIKVLDHGFVRLIDSMGSDLSVSRAARVSYDAPPREEDTKLIKYLKKNKHHTPFEAVTFTFEVKAPIFVFRQWHRHRTWTYNELSARYRQLPNEMYVPDLEQITTQSVNNKQQRTDEQHPEARAIRNEILMANDTAYEAYERLLAKGCPRELARGVLPLNTYSHMFCTVNLLNLMRFLALRNHSHAQYEIRVYAEAMLELARTVAPVSIAAFEEFGA